MEKRGKRKWEKVNKDNGDERKKRKNVERKNETKRD